MRGRKFIVAAAPLVGCLLQAQPAGADAIAVTNGSSVCHGSGGGYDVSCNGAYSANGWYYTPVIRVYCEPAWYWNGCAYGAGQSMGPEEITVASGGTNWSTPADSPIYMQNQTPPSSPPGLYLGGFWVWASLGYYSGGQWYTVCISVDCLVSLPAPPGGSCFAVGTPVLTPEGSKVIEQLRTGDLVLSSPEKVGDGQIVRAASRK